MRARGSHWLPLLAAAAAGVALYAEAVAGMVRQWIEDPAASHALLLVAAAAFVVYRRRERLRALPLEPANAGFGLLAVALSVFLAGSVTGDIFILRLSLPLAILGCIAALCGASHARALLAPIALLLLAIPLPAVIVTSLTLPLQLVASRVAEVVLISYGVEVTRSGNILMLPNIALEVAEACSGLRSVVSLVSVTAVIGAVMTLNAGRVLLLMAVAIPVAVIGNGFRVAATGLLTTLFGEIAVRGLFHELTGFVAFLAMCGAVLLVQAMTRRPVHAIPSSESSNACQAHV